MERGKPQRNTPRAYGILLACTTVKVYHGAVHELMLTVQQVSFDHVALAPHSVLCLITAARPPPRMPCLALPCAPPLTHQRHAGQY
ncbi:hypothetical protein E2C01_027826 [Portunus trituberculatus]|uniref:Uncharacterized protein n=1 Tax=Portunus trituberculatus TaxID=210409 RepID=A0A5B7EPX3_PORTR|nr:hypothetical protein [Portunus trituberculatus]